MALHDEGYRYTPLNIDQREIRLARMAVGPRPDHIQPDVAGPPLDHRYTPLSMVIETFSLATAPPYLALSYVWETPERTHVIICGGKSLPVTASLRAALGALPVENSWMWVDALCIDQSNIPERNSQLRLIQDIYSSATEVIAYLGDAPANRGDQTMLALKEGLQRGGKAKTQQDNKVDSASQLAGTASALATLLRSPWFARAWVMSEVALNKNVRFWYGNTDLPIQDLIDCVPATLQHVRSSLLDSAGLSQYVESSCRSTQRAQLHLNSIRTLRGALAAQEAMPLYRVLGCGRSAEATDPRDKVYAFMSLVHDKEILDVLRPDYSPSNSADDVYFALAQFSLRQQPSAIEMLRQAGHQRQCLPSWVPDLSQYLRHPFPDHVSYRSSGESIPCIRQVKDGSKNLLVRGAVVDVIHEVFEPCTFSFRDDVAYFSERPGTRHGADLFLACTRLHSFLHCKAEAYFRDRGYPTQEGLEDVIRRTLTADSSDRLDWRGYEAFCRLWKPPEACSGLAIVVEEELGPLFPQADAYMQAVALAQQGRRVAFTENSYLATVPDFAQEGDVLVLAMGMPMPLVLRPTHDGKASRYVGEAYVHGIMHGELVQWMGQEEGFSIDGGEVFDILVV
ncbi:hypothetical protein A1O3_06023 [Capronia epimyces CBS 606.96]|uniref:Heterokaryon incompatibility domain-containing protein n=1 Tax=Capronia epimyces CBS 606.96 TaxID=1182542 RepID=W9XXV6_9EURO|nr:uncharacterized protein A1O3_06023 [Capronia epimyces CBS 606.96]EXJ82210.1 hypothetical protein A1O3_06023 [Capronia epimyces CBS 606.96]